MTFPILHRSVLTLFPTCQGQHCDNLIIPILHWAVLRLLQPVKDSIVTIPIILGAVLRLFPTCQGQHFDYSHSAWGSAETISNLSRTAL